MTGFPGMPEIPSISAGGGGPSNARNGSTGGGGGFDGSNWAVNFGSTGGVGGSAMPAPRTVGYGSDSYGLPVTFSGGGGVAAPTSGVVISPLVLGLLAVVAVLALRRHG